MLVNELSKVLVEEKMKGRKPTVVILSEKDFLELVEDSPIKRDIFDPVIFFWGTHCS